MTEPQRRQRGFLITPFSQELNWLHDLVVEVSLREGVDTERADNIFAPGAILQQILDKIENADVIFAICTGKNPNVFFELGYAWQRHRPILIAEDTHDLPFDVAAFRTELYGRDTHGTDRHSLGMRLRKAVRATLLDENLPRGRRLSEAPAVQSASRLSAALHETGRSGSYRLVLTNSGTTEMHNVTVEVPKDATSFHLHVGDEFPLDILRPGESVKLLVSVSMGGGEQIFDLILHGDDPAGNALEFASKISL